MKKIIIEKIIKLCQGLYPYQDIVQWIEKDSKATELHNTLVHVGAHAGQEASAYERLNIQNVVWIEADPAIFKLLQENLEKRTESNTIHLAFNCLVTSQSNLEYQFHIFSNQGGSSSIFRSTNLVEKAWPGVRETGEILNLKSITLDSLLTQNKISPDLLLIDVQGAELEVLKGAQKTLTQIKAIELEVSKAAFYEGGCLYHELDLFLTSHGFSRMSFVPGHGNVLYIKNSNKLELISVKIADLFVELLRGLKQLIKSI